MTTTTMTTALAALRGCQAQLKAAHVDAWAAVDHLAGARESPRHRTDDQDRGRPRPRATVGVLRRGRPSRRPSQGAAAGSTSWRTGRAAGSWRCRLDEPLRQEYRVLESDIGMGESKKLVPNLLSSCCRC